MTLSPGGVAAGGMPGKTHRTEIQVRFADTDALGHVNNGSFVVYAETGRLEFARLLGATARALILAHIAVNFRRQVRFSESVVVFSWVERIGRTSVTLKQIIQANGELAADVTSVVVSFDYQTQQPTPWPSDARAALEAYRPADNASSSAADA